MDLIKEEIRGSFDHVKGDMDNITKWIKHLNSQDSKQDFKINDVDARLASMEEEIEGLKNAISLMDVGNFKRVFKTSRQAFGKQTPVQGVYSAVQTPVQTADNITLSNFSVMERALIMVLLNTDLKLSYDDLAAMTGKSRATIRGQINAIKQKSDSFLEEIIELNGKKRVFIPQEIKEKLLKNVKVRVSSESKSSKKQKKHDFDD